MLRIAFRMESVTLSRRSSCRLASLLLLLAGLVLLGCGRDPAKPAAQPTKAGPQTEKKDPTASTKDPTPAAEAENKDKADPNLVTLLVKGMV